jgi:pimeloyl-ACP methyl ester carboxylesterase
MYIEQHGEGTDCFLGLHGWGGTGRDFLPLVRCLPRDAKFVSMDLPGYGKSPPPAAWDEETIAGALSEVVRAVGVEKLTVVGYCSGAALGLLLAEREQRRIERLVMIDPFAFVPWYFRIFLAGEFGRRAYRFTFMSRLGRRLTSRALQWRQKTDDDFTAAFEKVDGEAALRWLSFLNRIGPASRFAGLRLKVDIVYGSNTFKAVRGSVREFRAVFPAARVVELADVGHLIMVRAARDLADILTPVRVRPSGSDRNYSL